jgi:hypothetical protein
MWDRGTTVYKLTDADVTDPARNPQRHNSHTRLHTIIPTVTTSRMSQSVEACRVAPVELSCRVPVEFPVELSRPGLKGIGNPKTPIAHRPSRRQGGRGGPASPRPAGAKIKPRAPGVLSPLMGRICLRPPQVRALEATNAGSHPRSTAPNHQRARSDAQGPTPNLWLCIGVLGVLGVRG